MTKDQRARKGLETGSDGKSGSLPTLSPGLGNEPEPTTASDIPTLQAVPIIMEAYANGGPPLSMTFDSAEKPRLVGRFRGVAGTCKALLTRARVVTRDVGSIGGE